jgi:hypothetical protein
MEKQSDFIRFSLRLPPIVHNQVEWWAELNRRSVNAEIVTRLEKSFDEVSAPSPFLEDIYQKLSELDATLKMQDKNFKLAAEYIQKIDDYIEEIGASKAKPPHPTELDLNLDVRLMKRMKNPK